MSPNRRIFLNIVATYGRSLFALVCGLFSARWVLEALGQEDFGLYGVVGGLVAFISVVNTLLGVAVGRFYAVSVGAAHVAEDKDAASARQAEAPSLVTLVCGSLFLAGEALVALGAYSEQTPRFGPSEVLVASADRHLFAHCHK